MDLRGPGGIISRCIARFAQPKEDKRKGMLVRKRDTSPGYNTAMTDKLGTPTCIGKAVSPRISSSSVGLQMDDTALSPR